MDGVQRMIRVIARSSVSDVALAVIACRALFNFCLDSDEAMEDPEADALHQLLSSTLETEEMKVMEHPQWDELQEVGVKLLEYLEDSAQNEEDEEEPTDE